MTLFYGFLTIPFLFDSCLILVTQGIETACISEVSTNVGIVVLLLRDHI